MTSLARKRSISNDSSNRSSTHRTYSACSSKTLAAEAMISETSWVSCSSKCTKEGAEAEDNSRTPIFRVRRCSVDLEASPSLIQLALEEVPHRGGEIDSSSREETLSTRVMRVNRVKRKTRD